jgi:hypothetical protein
MWWCCMDRRAGGRQDLAEHGYRLHAALTLRELVTQSLERQSGLLSGRGGPPRVRISMNRERPMTDLRVTLCGVPLPTPLVLASGIWGSAAPEP